MNVRFFLCLVLTTISLSAFAEESKTVKYREGKKIDFETLLIEGEGKKPELSIVTGNSGEKDLGLLKLRENFTDFIADDIGEEIK
jgi:hypothetical protein